MIRRRSVSPNTRTRSKRAGVVLLVGTALAVGLLGPVSPALAASTPILSAGPLTRVEISDDLNCAVDHTGDSVGEFFADTACGTLVAVGGTLYGPASIPAGGSASPRTAFTPISQSAVLGAGTNADPFRIVTVVGLGATGLQITETDSYVVGQETYRTDVVISNSGASSANAILYRAGDCFLQNSDFGFGAAEANGAVSCVAGVDTGGGVFVPGTRIEQWYPLSSGSSYYESGYSTVWAKIGSQTAFANLCEQCANYIDNGAGLSWNVTIPAGGSATRSHLTVFSPLGVVPLTTTKTAAQPSVAAGAADSYTITVSNPNTIEATLASITDTLPVGFTYTSGSTTGITTSNPGILGQVLTWTGPFTVAASGSVSLTFGVTVSSTPDTYFNVAGATANGQFTVVGTGPTAPVTVTGTALPAHLTLTKTVDNTGGGTALATAWTLSATGPTPISGATGDTAITNAAVGAGTYTLAESGGPSGYTAGTWSCTAGTLTGTSLVLAENATATCSITNTFVPPPAHLTLTKTVDNTGGGTALATAWTLSATGPTPISGHTGDLAITNAAVGAGTYALAETGPSGYTAGTWTCTEGTLTGSSLVLASGATATCSITNTFVPVVTVGLIAPTETTCEQYIAGTATALPGINYSVLGGVIRQNINPGVFFYFSTVTVRAGDVVTTSQSTTSSSGKLFLLNHDHAVVRDANCNKVGNMTLTNGGATGSMTFATAGTYILQLQYQTKSLAGTPAPSPANPRYTFDTEINGNEVVPDTTSISLAIQSRAGLGQAPATRMVQRAAPLGGSVHRWFSRDPGRLDRA
jgi:uncharacterized repeat protein (TIGR01451 family)